MVEFCGEATRKYAFITGWLALILGLTGRLLSSLYLNCSALAYQNHFDWHHLCIRYMQGIRLTVISYTLRKC
jgi:hypothetical protein